MVLGLRGEGVMLFLSIIYQLIYEFLGDLNDIVGMGGLPCSLRN